MTLDKVSRITRKVDTANFLANAGIWAELNSAGLLVNVTTDSPGIINKLPISTALLSSYESHDLRAGRITTLEDIGVRVTVNLAGYIEGTMAKGDMLVVSVTAGEEGKLTSVNDAAAGTYEVVAKCERVDSINKDMTFRIISSYSQVIS